MFPVPKCTVQSETLDSDIEEERCVGGNKRSSLKIVGEPNGTIDGFEFFSISGKRNC